MSAKPKNENYKLLQDLGYSDADIIRLVHAQLKKKGRHHNYSPIDLQEHQKLPDGDWYIFALFGGRASGKTHAGASYVIEHLRKYGEKAIVGIGAPTIGDARFTCAEGKSGLITLYKKEFRVYNRSILEAVHVGGGKVRFLGSEDPDRWNGPNWTFCWVDELALWNIESWDQVILGCRIGENPQIVATMTPKRRAFIRKLIKEEDVIHRQVSIFDNKYVEDRVKERYRKRYEGTKLARQELYGELLDDEEGAYINRDWIDNHRVEKAPDLRYVVVAVDPAASAHEKSDETGITVAARGVDGEYYVLFSSGYRLSPDAWAKKVIQLYDEYHANVIIAEKNNGGDMVENTIRHIRQHAPIKLVHAKKGKYIRGEDVQLLYEQGKVRHVGRFEETENQLCTIVVDDESGIHKRKTKEPDDRFDSLIYAIKGCIRTSEFRITEL